MRVEVANRQKSAKCPAAVIRKLVGQGLKLEGKDAELSVAVVGDAEMVELNRRFLGRDEVTDVIAFPYGAEGEVVSGEIVVNGELAAREAAHRTHSAQDELMLYVVHGLLHLLGYDDRKAADRRHMRQREQAVLKAAGHAVEF